MEKLLLNDGNSIPQVGFGVYLIPSDGSTYRAVREALDIGYRHIDTAAAYFNEEEVGRAVRESGIPREEIFVTSKLWLQDYAGDEARKGTETSLRKLGLDYIDLYLLHQPYGDVENAWETLEEMKEEGKLRSIGVSNMTPKLWKRYAPYFATLPAVDQVEFSPYIQQKELRSILDPLGVRLEAWGPIGRGIGHLLDDPTVTAIAERHGKTPAQVVLRFEVQEGVVVLPKSTHTDRMRSNLDIFGFALTESETEAMRDIDKNRGTHDPDAPGVGEALLANFDVHMND